MYKFYRYRDQYRKNLRLALPVMMSQLGAIIVQVADNAMVGRYGVGDPLPLAAASFANTCFFLPMIATMGMTFGLTPLIGELFAQGDRRESAHYLQNGLVLYTLISVVVAALQFAIIPLMGNLGQPAEVVAMAIPYYKTLVWSIIPVTLFFSIKQFLEGVGNTTVAMVCVITSNVVNILLNYMFIGGEWGAPEMGVTGAGIATLVARTLQMLIILLYLLRSTKFREYISLFSMRNFARESHRKLIKMGLPITSQLSLEVSTFVIIGFMFGWFSAEAISAFQIALTVGNASFMIVIAISTATTIRISHCLGERNISHMRRASSAAWHLVSVWGLIIAILYLTLSHQIPRLFTANEEVIEIASTLLFMIALYQIPDGLQAIGVGIMRGMQDVKIIPAIAFASYWLCNLPIAYLCAFHLGMGASGLYAGLVVGLVVAAILCYLRIKRQQRKLLLN